MRAGRLPVCGSTTCPTKITLPEAAGAAGLAGSCLRSFHFRTLGTSHRVTVAAWPVRTCAASRAGSERTTSSCLRVYDLADRQAHGHDWARVDGQRLAQFAVDPIDHPVDGRTYRVQFEAGPRQGNCRFRRLQSRIGLFPSL